jgi:hypothetical protein
MSGTGQLLLKVEMRTELEKMGVGRYKKRVLVM